MRDPLVVALTRLIEREGGRTNVADEIKSSDQTLYQIAKGVKDSKSGTPKGVGPSLRKRLDERYPGWRLLGESQNHEAEIATPKSNVVSVSEKPPLMAEMQAGNTSRRAPVVAWARLGDVVFEEVINKTDRLAFAPIGDHGARVILVPIADDALAPRLRIGDMVAIDLDNKQPDRDQVTLFMAKADGAFFLRRYQPLIAPHFEAIDAKNGSLDSQRHGLEIIGVRCGVRLADI